MSWYEKLDIVLFTYSLPLSAFFATYVVINVVMLPVLHYHIVYPLWMLFPTVVFLIAPMLNDIICYSRKMRRRDLMWYLGHSMLLYGSMMFTSLRSSLKSTFGKSVFLVTPKDHEQVSFFAALRASKPEIMFGIAVLCIAQFFDHSPLPTLLIAVPALLSVYLTMMANRE